MPTILSRHWTMEDALRTSRLTPNSIEQTLRYGRIHSKEQIRNDLERTARTLLDLLCDKFGKGTMSSGYRCPELNGQVGGSYNSAHTVGLAYDWEPQGTSIAAALIWAYANEEMLFDRLIVEQRGKSRWLHVQAPEEGAHPARLVYHSPTAGLFVRLNAAQILALNV